MAETQLGIETINGSIELQRPQHTLAAVLDGGSQYTAHNVRALRAEGCDAEVLPINTPYEELASGRYDVVVATGGPDDINEVDTSERIDPRVMAADSEIPFLGLCRGMHELVDANGGKVVKYAQREVKIEEVSVDPNESIYEGLDSKQLVQNSHGISSKRDDIPEGLHVIAMSGEGDNAFVAGVSDKSGKRVGLQYHPEVDPSVNGRRMIGNFLRNNCGLACDFVPEDRHVTAARKIKPVRDSGQKALLGFSAGVDSTVAAELLHESLGNRLVGLHIDTGFNRKGEAARAKAVAEHIGFQLEVVDATQEFQHARRYLKDKLVMYSYTDLKDTYDYFKERLIFSATYAAVIKEALGRMGLSPENSYLAQGTLYTDIIESGHSGKKTATIKPHHNIGGAFSAWQDAQKLVQPLDYFFKDDVRAIGTELGLPDDFIWRQPFPGPGLMVRVLNLIKAPGFEKIVDVQRAMRLYQSNDDAIHVLPLRATGNPGDGPEYKHMVAITSDDGLQPRHYDIAKELPNTVRDIGGVVFIEGGKVPQNVDVYENVIPTDLSTATMDLAREVDAVVDEASVAHGLGRLLAQEPVALSAFQPHGTDGRLALLRPVDTVDFFTAQAARPGSRTFPEQAYRDQVEAAMSVRGVGGVAIDLADKPPRTIEYK